MSGESAEERQLVNVYFNDCLYYFSFGVLLTDVGNKILFLYPSFFPLFLTQTVRLLDHGIRFLSNKITLFFRILTII